MSRFDQAIFLLGATITEDEIGNQIEVPSERMAFARQLYVGANEFYNAAIAGLRPEKRFEVYSFDYQGEGRLKHNGIIYRIIRTEPKGEKTWLSCEKVAAYG